MKAKCKCGSSEMTFKFLNEDMNGKWECEKCPKQLAKEPKKEEAPQLEEVIVEAPAKEAEIKEETPKKSKKSRRSKKAQSNDSN